MNYTIERFIKSGIDVTQGRKYGTAIKDPE